MRLFLLWLAWTLLFLAPSPGFAQEITAGVGRVDITPKGPIWLAGYGNRTRPSVGVDASLYIKALVLQIDKETPFLLVSADLLGFPRHIADNISQRIEKDLKIPRTNLLLAASHTHTGPLLTGAMMRMFDLKDEEIETVQAYSRQLEEQVFVAAESALQSRRPARLSYASSRADFAVNRRVYRGEHVGFGVNPDGPVDHEVPVLRIDDAGGQVRAVVFGYACHCTSIDPDQYRINGDWAGFAQEYLERVYPGATALFLTGCGGDANPFPRGKLDHARQHGLEIAGAVSQALKKKRTPLLGPFTASWDRVDLPLAGVPSRAELEKRLAAKAAGVYPDRSVAIKRQARRFLDQLDRGEKLPTSVSCPVQVWQFGKELTIVALGGEVVVDYSHRLKRELPGNHVWVAAYANDVFAYVPSRRILLEGGYEADFNMIYYDLPTRFSHEIEDILVKKAAEMVKK